MTTRNNGLSILAIQGKVEAVHLTDAPHRLAAAKDASIRVKASFAGPRRGGSGG